MANMTADRVMNTDLRNCIRLDYPEYTYAMNMFKMFKCIYDMAMYFIEDKASDVMPRLMEMFGEIFPGDQSDIRLTYPEKFYVYTEKYYDNFYKYIYIMKCFLRRNKNAKEVVKEIRRFKIYLVKNGIYDKGDTDIKFLANRLKYNLVDYLPYVLRKPNEY